MTLCPLCQQIADTDHLTAVASRVTLHKKPWSGSPPVWLGGDFADLATLTAAGYAERNPAGWFIPTSIFLED